MTSSLLLILLLIPLVGAAVVAWLPRGKDELIRPFALVTTLANFVVSLLVFSQFDWSRTGDLQLASSATWVKSFGLSFGFGVDSISLWLVLLTTFLMPIVILGSFSAVSTRVKEFFVWLLILETAMIGTFIATDVIFFYICFEFTSSASGARRSGSARPGCSSSTRSPARCSRSPACCGSPGTTRTW